MRLSPEQKGVKDNQALLPAELRKENQRFPRFARINTLKSSEAEVCAILKTEGYIFEDSSSQHHDVSLTPTGDPQSMRLPQIQTQTQGGEQKGNAEDSKRLSVSAEGKVVRFDPHVPSLLVFSPTADLHDHPLVESGKLVLQVRDVCPASLLRSPLFFFFFFLSVFFLYLTYNGARGSETTGGTDPKTKDRGGAAQDRAQKQVTSTGTGEQRHAKGRQECTRWQNQMSAESGRGAGWEELEGSRRIAESLVRRGPD